MRNQLKDILNIENIHGVIFLNLEGEVVFKEFISHIPEETADINWLPFIHTLNGVQEAELVFDKIRFYLRQSRSGYIIVVMDRIAIIEMVRLNCDIILPALEETPKKASGLMRFFKRK